MADAIVGDLVSTLRGIGVDPAGYDLICRGDGSGTFDPAAPDGFACAMAHAGGRRELVYGAFSCGTNMNAELDAYVLVVRHYGRSPGRKPHPRVAIVCDNQTVVRQGTREYRRRVNRPSWAVFDFLEREGWKFDWFWVGRNQEVGMALCDALAGAARKALIEAAARVQFHYSQGKGGEVRRER